MILSDIIMTVVNAGVVAVTHKIVQFVYLQGKNGMIAPVHVPVHVQLGVNVPQDTPLIMSILAIASPLT